MPTRQAAFVVVGESVTVVDAEVPDDGSPVTIISDSSWTLQQGDRGPALAVLHQRCSDYLRENNIDLALIKASALPTGSAKLGLLTSAEVRGVVIAAAAAVTEVQVLSKASISRTYGSRKVDEYVADDDFWVAQIRGGRLRKTSREAVMLILAARGR